MVKLIFLTCSVFKTASVPNKFSPTNSTESLIHILKNLAPSSVSWFGADLTFADALLKKHPMRVSEPLLKSCLICSIRYALVHNGTKIDGNYACKLAEQMKLSRAALTKFSYPFFCFSYVLFSSLLFCFFVSKADFYLQVYLSLRASRWLCIDFVSFLYHVSIKLTRKQKVWAKFLCDV